MHGRSQGRARCTRIALALAVGSCVAAGRARASEPFEVPPAPRDRPADWALEAHLDGVFPVDTDALCPDGSRCVYAGGGGVGATAERRWPVGLGGLLGYDVWFIDSTAVYELGVQQTFYGGVRYTSTNATMAHAVVEVGAGVAAYGDTFRVDSVGFVVQGVLALEVELTHHFGLLGGVGLRASSSNTFTTERDGVTRGGGGRLSEVLLLRIGLTVHGRPWATAEP